MKDNLSNEKLQALLVAVRRIDEAYFEIQRNMQDGPSPNGDKRVDRRAQKHCLDIKRSLRSSLLCTAYSITEKVLESCIGKSGEEAARAFVKNGEKPALLHKVECQFRNLLQRDFNQDWEHRWSDFHDLRQLRNFIVHEGGIFLEPPSKIIVRKVLDGEIPNAWFESFFIGTDTETKVIVIGELLFRHWIDELQVFALDVDAALLAVAK